MDQGVSVDGGWRLWECTGHLLNEYEGPSYYNFVNDK